MRKTIKGLALLLALAVLLSVPVYAAESDPITPFASPTLSQYCVFLYVPSGNEIQVWFDVVGTRYLDRIGAARIEVQRSSDCATWTTVQVYQCSDYTNMIATNEISYESYVTHYGSYGYYYRAYVTIQGFKDGTGSTRFVYTDIIYLGS